MSHTKTRQNEEDLELFPGKPPETADWTAHDEGELAVDVYDRPNEIVLRSAIAGVKPEDLDVFVHNDMLTVRGTRSYEHEEHDGNVLVRECHWGGFSRSIILPSEVDADNIAATLKNGVLTVRMPKVERSRRIAVRKV